MSIRIIAKGTRLYKREELTGLEVELHGKEKAFYLKEIGAIDQGKGDGQRIGNDHRDYCECQECVKGTDKDTEDRYRDGYPEPELKECAKAKLHKRGFPQVIAAAIDCDCDPEEGLDIDWPPNGPRS